MELDDLKQQWKQADKLQIPKNKNIMDIIQHKSHGPFAELKKSFKRQMIAMTVVPIAIIALTIPSMFSILLTSV